MKLDLLCKDLSSGIVIQMCTQPSLTVYSAQRIFVNPYTYCLYVVLGIYHFAINLLFSLSQTLKKMALDKAQMRLHCNRFI